jgi:hypothetical protein
VRAFDAPRGDPDPARSSLVATFITIGYGDPVQVRNHDDAGVRTAAGAFMRSDLPIAGFAVGQYETATFRW